MLINILFLICSLLFFLISDKFVEKDKGVPQVHGVVEKVLQEITV
jgi:hypothetical protein